MKFFKKIFLLSLCLTLISNLLNAADPRRALHAAIKKHDMAKASELLKEVEEFLKGVAQPRLFLLEQAKFNAEFATELEQTIEEEDDDDDDEIQEDSFIDDSSRRESHHHQRVDQQFKRALIDNDFSTASALIDPLKDYYESAGQVYLFYNALAEYQNKFSRQIRRKRRQFVKQPAKEELYSNDGIIDDDDEEIKAELKKQISNLHKEIELILDKSEEIIDDAAAKSFLNVLAKAEASGIKLTTEEKRIKAEIESLQTHKKEYDQILQQLNDGTLANIQQKPVVPVIKKPKPPVPARDKKKPTDVNAEKEVILPATVAIQDSSFAADQGLELGLKQEEIALFSDLSLDNFKKTLKEILNNPRLTNFYRNEIPAQREVLGRKPAGNRPAIPSVPALPKRPAIKKYDDSDINYQQNGFQLINHIADLYDDVLNNEEKANNISLFYSDNETAINNLLRKIDDVTLIETEYVFSDNTTTKLSYVNNNGTIKDVENLWESLNNHERQLFYKICNILGYMKTPNPRINTGTQAAKIAVAANKQAGAINPGVKKVAPPVPAKNQLAINKKTVLELIKGQLNDKDDKEVIDDIQSKLQAKIGTLEEDGNDPKKYVDLLEIIEPQNDLATLMTILTTKEQLDILREIYNN